MFKLNMKAHYVGTFRARFFFFFGYILYYFGGIFSLFHLATQNEFLAQSLQHNSCYLSNDNFFSQNFYVLKHLCLFE